MTNKYLEGIRRFYDSMIQPCDLLIVKKKSHMCKKLIFLHQRNIYTTQNKGNENTKYIHCWEIYIAHILCYSIPSWLQILDYVHSIWIMYTTSIWLVLYCFTHLLIAILSLNVLAYLHFHREVTNLWPKVRI